MRLTHTLSNEVVVLRLSDQGNNTMLMATVTSDMKTELQPLADDKSSIAEGVYGKAFAMYTDGRVSMYPGDRLRDRDNNYYTVKSGAVSNRQHGRISFTKIIIELTE